MRVSIRRVAHLAGRFATSLRPRAVDTATTAWVRASLTPAELDVWEAMSAADRAESVRVARRLDRVLADGAPAADTRWRAAALLHDAGKTDAGLGTAARVVATLVVAAAGSARARGWAGAPGARGRVGRYAAHDDLGAARLCRAGARPEAVAWAAAHHRPERWTATGIPIEVCRALARADGEVVGGRRGGAPAARRGAVRPRPGAATRE